MARHEFSLKTIQEIDDGRVAVAFDQVVKGIVADLYDRPGEKKERIVKLEVKLTPVIDQSGFCESVGAQSYCLFCGKKHPTGAMCPCWEDGKPPA